MSAPQDIDPGNRPRASSKSRTRDEEEISEWLAQNGLKQYADLFIRERISLKSIPYLEESHLKEMGIPVGDRIKLKQATKTESPPPDPSIGPSSESPKSEEEQPKPQHKREPSRDLKKSTPVKLSSSTTKSASLLVSVPTPPKKVMPTTPNVEQEEFQCKIVVIGPPTAGKTSLVRRYTQNKFEKGYKQTIGVDFEVKTVQRPENILIHVQLWDIAGQERFSSVVPQFYRSTAAALVVFDVTEESTLQAALKWNEHFQKHEVMTSGRSIPVMLVANKVDMLPDDKRPDLEDICKKSGITAWWFTSAKTNLGINEAIDFLLDNILNSSGIETKSEKEEVLVDLSRPKAAKKEEDYSCPC